MVASPPQGFAGIGCVLLFQGIAKAEQAKIQQGRFGPALEGVKPFGFRCGQHGATQSSLVGLQALVEGGSRLLQASLGSFSSDALFPSALHHSPKQEEAHEGHEGRHQNEDPPPQDTPSLLPGSVEFHGLVNPGQLLAEFGVLLGFHLDACEVKVPRFHGALGTGQGGSNEIALHTGEVGLVPLSLLVELPHLCTGGEGRSGFSTSIFQVTTLGLKGLGPFHGLGSAQPIPKPLFDLFQGGP